MIKFIAYVFVNLYIIFSHLINNNINIFFDDDKISLSESFEENVSRDNKNFRGVTST
jgi:hypothetical protein